MNIQKLTPIKKILLDNLNEKEFEWIGNLGTAFSSTTFSAPTRSNDDIGIILKDADIQIKGNIDGDRFSVTSKVIEVVYDESDQVLALKLADGTLCFSEAGIVYSESAGEYEYEDISIDDIRIILAKD